ncbi:zinc-binding dehydrogenase [Glaciecola sp. 1036]|uniref:zinc-binding dehydrogenase n=1 Tax=Alteromonadaceae TaxID=72275 RepID=UPI003D0669AF
MSPGFAAVSAGVTTYTPILKFNLKKGDKVGVAGIGGLGHLAVKLAVSKGAEVYAFTTTADKVEDIKSFGAKEVIVVDSLDKLNAYRGQLDYMISTLPVAYDVAAYASVLKPFGTFTQVGMPEKFTVSINTLGLSAFRVNFNASLIGDMKETQDIVDYCAANNIRPEIQLIPASEINAAWKKVENKQARYRYVIDSSTI